jgi:tRNA threonylcarbamoyladenosine biosynthesis protein TsaB
MTNILAIDTSGPVCKLALQSKRAVIERSSEAERQSAQRILPMLEGILTESGQQLKHLDAICVMAGPGSFTGLRIGIAVAQGLSMSADLPLIPISNLAARARSVFRELGDDSSLEISVICEVAREGEIYFATYGKSAGLAVELLGKEQVALPESLLIPDQFANSSHIAIAGNAWAEIDGLQQTLLAGKELLVVESDPAMDDLLALANIKLGLGETVKGVDLKPNYVKEELDYS